MKSLLKDPRLIQVLKDELEWYSRKLKSYEVIKEYAFISEPFSVENGMMTPKMSLKRHNIEVNYKELLDSLYAKLEKTK